MPRQSLFRGLNYSLISKGTESPKIWLDPKGFGKLGKHSVRAWPALGSRSMPQRLTPALSLPFADRCRTSVPANIARWVPPNDTAFSNTDSCIPLPRVFDPGRGGLTPGSSRDYRKTALLPLNLDCTISLSRLCRDRREFPRPCLVTRLPASRSPI